MQERDPFLGVIIRLLRGEDVSGDSVAAAVEAESLASFCFNSDGVLFKQLPAFEHAKLARERFVRYVLALPEPLRAVAMRSAHDAMAGGGHGGPQSMYIRLATRYWWPTLKKDLREYCRTCAECQRIKTPTRRRAHIAGDLQEPKAQPAQHWHIDLSGPFNTTRRGNNYTFEAVDLATRFTVAAPIPNKEARTVAQVICDDIIGVFGMPLSIHSDQGDEFVNAVLAELCLILGIQRTTITPYHPQGNGIVERSNRTRTRLMAFHAHSHPHDWDRFMFAHQLSMNAAYSSSVLEQPFFLMLGFAPRLAIDNILGLAQAPVQAETAATEEALQLAFELARLNAEAVRKTTAEHNASLVEPQCYQRGQLVWVAAVPDADSVLAPKLQAPYEGPFTVARVVNPVCIDYYTGTAADAVRRVHVSNVKPYTSSARPAPLELAGCTFLGRPLIDVRADAALPDDLAADGAATAPRYLRDIISHKPGRGRPGPRNFIYQTLWSGSEQPKELKYRDLEQMGLRSVVAEYHKNHGMRL
jgi:transposase InsO family protein